MRKKQEDETVVGEAEPAEGTVGPEETVVVDLDKFEPHRAPESPPTYDLSSIALEVIGGQWGTGQDRRTRLSKAGYNVREVEDEVVRQLNP